MTMNKAIDYTVKDLIEDLKKLPQDFPVLVSGYEDGFENILKPKTLKVKHKPKNAYWSGEFQETEKTDNDTFDAIVLRRKVRN